MNLRTAHARRAALWVGAALIAVACARVPITGRAQLDLVPDETMHELGKTAFETMLEEHDRQTGPDAELLERLGARLVESTPRVREPQDWNFALLEDDTANAWALPGGYVGVHTGILPILRNEAGMAFVTGHEVAHVAARHGAERVSQQIAVLGGLTALQAWLAGRTEATDDQRDLALAAAGLGAQVGVLLPFSRTHESEADIIALLAMSSAGYPPQEALEIWNRMEQAQDGPQPPTWLSTHPTHAERRDILRQWLPQAERRYARNRLRHDTTETRWDDERLAR